MAADGDAGAAYLQGVNNPLTGDPNNPYASAAQVNAFAEGAKNLLGQAKSGGWAINEEGGTHFLNAVEAAQKQVEELKPRILQLKQAPKLGNDSYAQSVGQHVKDSMDSDETSLVPVMNKFYEGLDAVREAIETAKKNYNASDEAGVKHLGAFQD